MKDKEPIAYKYIDSKKNDAEPVYVLQKREAAIAREIELLQSEDWDQTEAQFRTEKLQEMCEHKYFIDEPGFTYHERNCVVCGCFLKLI